MPPICPPFASAAAAAAGPWIATSQPSQPSTPCPPPPWPVPTCRHATHALHALAPQSRMLQRKEEEARRREEELLSARRAYFEERKQAATKLQQLYSPSPQHRLSTRCVRGVPVHVAAWSYTCCMHACSYVPSACMYGQGAGPCVHARACICACPVRGAAGRSPLPSCYCHPLPMSWCVATVVVAPWQRPVSLLPAQHARVRVCTLQLHGGTCMPLCRRATEGEGWGMQGTAGHGHFPGNVHGSPGTGSREADYGPYNGGGGAYASPSRRTSAAGNHPQQPPPQQPQQQYGHHTGISSDDSELDEPFGAGYVSPPHVQQRRRAAGSQAPTASCINYRVQLVNALRSCMRMRMSCFQHFKHLI